MELLKKNAYPGRGIILGLTPDGKNAVAAYFIMGRSVNSRNRIFTPTEDGIRTQAHDPTLMQDPHLIIYHPVREWENFLIVTNGDQTDTIRDFLGRGDTFENALRSRCFEDDAPNFTPRISGLQSRDGSYKLSILKEKATTCVRHFFEYSGIPGQGHFISTYVQDGNPLPPFAGEPVPVEIPQDLENFTQMLWESLNEDNKISLFVRYTDLESGEYVQKILNKNGG